MSRVWVDLGCSLRALGRDDVPAVVQLPTRQTGRWLAADADDVRGLGTYLAMCPPSRLATVPEMCPPELDESPPSAEQLEMCPPTLPMTEEGVCPPSSDASSSNVDERVCRGCHDDGDQNRDDLRCSPDVDSTGGQFILETVSLAVGDSEFSPARIAGGGL